MTLPVPGPAWIKTLQNPESSVRLGPDPNGSPVWIDDRQRAQHTYVLGKSGVGKTMLLTSIVLQDLLREAPVVFLDLIGTGVPYLRQCLAAINLGGLAGERGPYPALNQRLRQERERFFRRICVIELDSVQTQDRFNPLEPVPGMTTAELAEAFAAAIERMLGGKLSEMRALHLNLVGLASVVIDTGGGTLQDLLELCCMDTQTMRQYLRRLERKRAKGRLGIPVRRDLVTRYMTEFFAMTSGRERRELCASTLRALALILSDPVAQQLLSSPTGNLNLDAVMAGEQSLLVNAPPHNLHTQTVISSLILGRLSALAMRRSSQDVSLGRVPQVHVIVDEFQRCFGEEMAADLAVLRNKGLSLILAHQSSNQPPFHTPEGQAMLASILDNTSLKVLMRMGQKDAREHVGAAYMPRGHLVKRQTQEVTHTQTQSAGRTISQAQAQGRTRTEGHSQTQSQTQSLSQACARSSSQAEGTQSTRTEGRSHSRTEGESETSSHTVTTGKTQGSSFTRTQGISQSEGDSTSQGQGHNTGAGHSTSRQMGQSESTARHSGSGARDQYGASQGQTWGSSEHEGQSWSHQRSTSRSRGRTASQARGLSESRSRSEAQGQSSTRSSSRTEGQSQSQSEGRSHTRTCGQSRTQTRGLSQGESQGRSHSQARSQTQTTTQGQSQTHSEGASVREVTEYYSVMEEQIVRSYELQGLPNRSAIVLRQGDGASTMQRMRTLDMPQDLVTRVGPLDGLADLRRLIAPPPPEPAPSLDLAERLRLEQSLTGEEDE